MIHEIIKYFDENQIAEEQFVIDKCSVVKKPKKFVESHISTLLANSSNITFLPYFERLYKYYEFTRKTNNLE
jgi:tRNA A58 N-methylase Trm61